MLLPIYPKYNWYGIRAMAGVSVNEGEDGWVKCGSDGDECRVVEVGDDKAVVEGCV